MGLAWMSSEIGMSKTVLIINQVFWPDKHNTARHISELSSELVQRGWQVTALIGNRSYFDYRKNILPTKGIWNGVHYTRVYVPPFNHKNYIQRLVAAFWLIVNFITWLPRIGKYDVIVIGSNPPFLYVIAPFLKLLKSNSKIVMWGFDLYPEAIIVTGGAIWKFLGVATKSLTRWCYKKLDVIVDIGPCMRELFRKYRHSAVETTLTPWSFIEPEKITEAHHETRLALFGDAKLKLLYSGTIGNAHEFDNFLRLARNLKKRNGSIHFCFAGFGSRLDDLKSQITAEDTNITFAGFVKNDIDLERRLSSTDIMLISLKEDWVGISVPSKYFGALACGKPVIFSGSKSSSLSIWTREYKVGFHVSEDNMTEIEDWLCMLSENVSALNEMKENAFNIYQSCFSKKAICDNWSKLLEETTKTS